MKRVLFAILFGISINVILAQEAKTVDNEKLSVKGVAQVEIAKQKMYSGQYKPALATFKEVLIESPKNSTVLYYAADCSHKLGDDINAVKYLEAFSTSAKQIQMMAYGALGDAYSELGKNDDAIKNYQKAAETFDSDELNASEYLFRAAYLYETLGKNKEAVDLFKQLKDKYPLSTRGREADKHIFRLSDPSQFSSNN